MNFVTPGELGHNDLNETECSSSAHQGSHLPPIVSRPGTTLPVRSSPAPGRSIVEQFIENFFHETSIKWMLMVGAAIVFGSSLMLVTRHWTTWPGSLKFLTVLGYTTAIYLISDVCRARLGLARTAMVLQGLTVMLLPTSYIALSWFLRENSANSFLGIVQIIGLMILALAMTWFAAGRIFDHWLRGRQTVFLASYLLLSVAGALPTVEHSWLSGVFVFACWSVMTVGVIKVNRHVFWLTEENRWPRVFGFLPISILASLFAIVVALKSVGSLPIEWMGLPSVLVGATVLLTARSVTHVFRQRTGDLVRPLPWNIIAPLFVGLVLVAVGVCLSFYGFSYVGNTTIAAVPTVATAAVLLLLVARDTRHAAFVWTALVLITVTYQSTPTLMADLVQYIKSAAASAVQESRLPIAFYGLTYLPLILVYAWVSRRLELGGEILFSKPLKRFATLLTIALFMLSATHVKALHMVSGLNVGLFLALAVLLRDRRYIFGMLAALLAAAATFIPFAKVVYAIEISDGHTLTSLLVLATSMILTRFPDRLCGLIRLPKSEFDGLFVYGDGRQRPLFYTTGQVVLVLLSVYWFAQTITIQSITWQPMHFVHCFLLLSAWIQVTIRSGHYLAGLSVWSIAATSLGCLIANLGMPISQAVGWATVVFASCSAVSGLSMNWLYRRRGSELSWQDLRASLGIDFSKLTVFPVSFDRVGRQVFAALVVPLGDLAWLAMMALLLVVHIPQLVLTVITLVPLETPWVTTIAVVWAVVPAALQQSRATAIFTTCTLPAFCSALVISLLPGQLNYGAQLLIWSIVVCLESLVLNVIKDPVSEKCRYVCNVWAILVNVLSCMSFDPIFRAAGCCSLAVLYLSNDLRNHRQYLAPWAILANVQVLLLAAYLGGMNGAAISLLQLPNILVSGGGLLLLAMGISLFVFELRIRNWESQLIQQWVTVLRCSIGLQVVAAFGLARQLVIEQVFIETAMALLAAAELASAIRLQSRHRVWTFLAVLAVMFAWLGAQQVIQLGIGASQIILIAVTIFFIALGNILSGHATLGFSARVFARVGDAGPALIAVFAVIREMTGNTIAWQGLNALALFTAAGLYFFRWLHDGSKRHVVASGAILNVALILLWRSFGWHDFQLYLVPLGLSILGLTEILSGDLPRATHTPLRYVGALTILVSPVFQILDGSWLHIITLMVLSVLVVLLAIGLRVRALINTGSAFLLAGLVAMVVRSSIDHPSLLWISGFGLGIAVIALAAYCENHREKLLTKIRLMSAELATWR